jgi:hypothetical protein
LLRIQFARVINLQIDFGTERFNNVIARHGPELKGQNATSKRKKAMDAQIFNCQPQVLACVGKRTQPQTSVCAENAA